MRELFADRAAFILMRQASNSYPYQLDRSEE